MNFKKFFWQIFFSYIILTTIIILSIIWFSLNSTKKFYYSQTKQDLKARAFLLLETTTKLLEEKRYKSLDETAKDVGTKSKTRITIILPTGKVVADTFKNPEEMDNHLTRPEIKNAGQFFTGWSLRYSKTLKKQMMYVAVAIKKSNKIIGFIRTSVPLASMNETLFSEYFKFFIFGLFIVVLTIILSFFISGKISKPIEKLKLFAKKYALGDFSSRFIISENIEEFLVLGKSINNMADEIENQIQKITNQRNELEEILSSMLEGIVAIDNRGKILRINSAAKKIMETNKEIKRGTLFNELLIDSSIKKAFFEAIDSQELVEKEILLQKKSLKHILFLGSPLTNNKNQKIGELIVLNDITKIKRLEKIRQEFVANVSHELKTPITSIKGFAETLIETNFEDKKTSIRFLNIILKHTNRLNTIIDDLLSLSRLENHEKIVFEKANLLKTINSSIESCQNIAKEKNIKIELNCAQNIFVEINRPLFEQALINLINNAIKYSNSDKTIEISVKKENQKITISVKDEGFGIPEKEKNRIFERFYRVDKARSKKEGGTGLGLSIVKHIINIHGGTISVESKINKGSIFKITFNKD